MIIFCFDNDESTANTIRAVLAKSFKFSLYANKSMPEMFRMCEGKSDVIIFIDTRYRVQKQGSFALAASIREKLPLCHIVFISSYPEDMPLCFKNLIRPSGFLMKPFTKGEIISVVADINDLVSRAGKGRTLLISTHDMKRMVDINNIVYFSTFGKKIFCRLVNGERIEFYSTLAELEVKYQDDFIRCHSGFLVNRLYIKGIKKGEVELYGFKETLPISQKYKHIFTEDVIKQA